MKVLLDCSLLSVGGGVQNGLSVLANATHTPDFEWHAVISESIASQLPLEHRQHLRTVVMVPGRTRARLVTLPRRLREIERSVKPDVVFTVCGPSVWQADAPHLQGFALPTVIYPEVSVPGATLAERVFGALHRIHKAKLARRAQFLVVQTEIVKRRLGVHLGISSDRVFVVRNCYSPIFKKALSETPKISHGDSFVFAVPSSYFRHKNVEFIASVARELRQLTARPFRFEFTIPAKDVGWTRIQQAGHAMGVQQHLVTRGMIPHAQFATVYRSADAVFLPTLLECSSAVYPESFLSEVPLVTSDTDFAHYLCSDGAAYVDPRNPLEAARVLANVIEDDQFRTRLVERGSAVLAENYVSPEHKWNAQLDCIRTAAHHSGPTGKSIETKRTHALGIERRGAIDFHERIADQWEGKYQKKSFSARRDAVASLVNGHDLTNQRWLDAGCGSGHFARFLAERGCAVDAVDASPAMIRVATEQASNAGLSGRIEFRCVEGLETMPLERASLDGVLCISVLEYLERPDAMITRFANALRPDGMLLVSVPNRLSVLRRVLCSIHRLTLALWGHGWPQYLSYSRSEYSAAEFAKLLTDRGLVVEGHQFLGGPLPSGLQRNRHLGPLCMFIARRGTLDATAPRQEIM